MFISSFQNTIAITEQNLFCCVDFRMFKFSSIYCAYYFCWLRFGFICLNQIVHFNFIYLFIFTLLEIDFDNSMNHIHSKIAWKTVLERLRTDKQHCFQCQRPNSQYSNVRSYDFVNFAHSVSCQCLCFHFERSAQSKQCTVYTAGAICFVATHSIRWITFMQRESFYAMLHVHARCSCLWFYVRCFTMLDSTIQNSFYFCCFYLYVFMFLF